ncbi:uncharacterized protein LOC127793146 [Diospyros lotus]|uniref:uncharacterized protein LOC127793146 n=1 Tax=Diospyros lotus TaxID=55363 RepID=UPI00225593D2|nr:uncharacterized protein LOC127793146 [Diospyros lotus]
MGISKTEINLRRLLAAAPNQQNQAKLLHYVATLREQLEELAQEKTPEGIPRVSKGQLNDYSEKIEAIAHKSAVPESTAQESEKPPAVITAEETPPKSHGESPNPSSPTLRRRFVPQSKIEERQHNSVESDNSASVKLDSAAWTHVEKHRQLQENLTDEMVVLARQLKESSLVMSQSLKNTEKILDSTEKAVENSLASTGHANTRAMEIYSRSFKTTCFTWLVILLMTCVFIMVVLLIRVT